MRRVTYGVLLFAFLIAALFVADGLQSPQEPEPDLSYTAPPPLPSVPPVAVRIEEIDRVAALKLAANAQSFMAGYEGPASEVDQWAK